MDRISRLNERFASWAREHPFRAFLAVAVPLLTLRVVVAGVSGRPVHPLSYLLTGIVFPALLVSIAVRRS